MSAILYGIPNCGQVKKARTWLDSHAAPHSFHDFKKAGITREVVEDWLRDVAWEVLVNRKGTTWRALPEARKAAIVDAAGATDLMLEATSIIKRPVLQIAGKTYVGFSDELYQQIFKK